jgi:hypothetical protein
MVVIQSRDEQTGKLHLQDRMPKMLKTSTDPSGMPEKIIPSTPAIDKLAPKIRKPA